MYTFCRFFLHYNTCEKIFLMLICLYDNKVGKVFNKCRQQKQTFK